MGNSFHKTVLILIALTFVFQAQGQNQNISDRARRVVSENIESNREYLRTATAVHESADRQPSGPNINEASKTASQSQGAGQMLNMIASAGLFSACAASCPKCRMELCAMGALAALQGAQDKAAQNASNITDNTSRPDNDPLKPASPDPDSGNTSFTPTIKNGLEQLKNAGYSVSEKGVSYPDGSFKPASAFNSPNSMMAAGIDAKTAALAGEVLDAINKEIGKVGANVSSMAVDAGAAGSSGSGGYDEGENPYMTKFKNPFQNADSKKLLNGKVLMVSGEPIGVKGANIFDMVHQAYQGKRKRKQFMETTNGVRLPASKSGNSGL